MATRDRVDPNQIDTTPRRRPEWLRVRMPDGVKLIKTSNTSCARKNFIPFVKKLAALIWVSAGFGHIHISDHGRYLHPQLWFL